MPVSTIAFILYEIEVKNSILCKSNIGNIHDTDSLAFHSCDAEDEAGV